MSDRAVIVGLVVVAAAYLGLAGWVPPTDDELYYWCWSRDLQLSYYDHPPLTAYLIRAATAVFGDSVAALRLPACLASVGVLAVIARLTRPRHLLPWLALTPPFTFGAVLITPDTPLTLFWALYLLWLVGAHRRLDAMGTVRPVYWMLGGLVLGLGVLGKYTIALAGPAGFVSFVVTARPWRSWLPGYTLHGAVAALGLLPILLFNAAHDFAPVRFQWAHAMAAGEGAGGGGLGSLAGFVGAQVLLFGLLPFAAFPWVVANARTLCRDPALRPAVCLYAGPFAFFLLKAATGAVEANWALASYLGLWPLAARWGETVGSEARRRWLTAGAFAVPVACTVAVGVHLVSPVGLLPPARDRITRQAVRLDLARQAADLVRAEGGAAPVYAPTYQWTALLRYAGADARQLDGITRASHFTARPEHLTDAAVSYLFSEGALPPAMTPGFGPPEVVRTFPLVVRGVPVSVFYLIRYTRVPPNSPDRSSDRCTIP